LRGGKIAQQTGRWLQVKGVKFLQKKMLAWM
jgi:hypothetical protein